MPYIMDVHTSISELFNNHIKYHYVQWKTGIFCLQSIYCKHWNNYIITVQHSPLLVQCTYSSGWQAHRFREKRIVSDGCTGHSCTANWTSLSSRNCVPLSASFNVLKTWKSGDVRLGEYGGCGMHSNCSSSIVDTVAVAVCGLALSWRRRTSNVSNPCCFWRIAGFRFPSEGLSRWHWSQCFLWECGALRSARCNPRKKSTWLCLQIVVPAPSLVLGTRCGTTPCFVAFVLAHRSVPNSHPQWRYTAETLHRQPHTDAEALGKHQHVSLSFQVSVAWVPILHTLFWTSARHEWCDGLIQH